MSVAGISSASFSGYTQGPSGSNSMTNRQSEDVAARQLITDLEKGDLSGAQQAYNTLASFGPNNSGPWGSGQMQSEFQALGQDLQSGNLSGAKADVKSLASHQLASDVKLAEQDYQSGNQAAYQQAVENYKSDYWAAFGSMPQSNPPVNGGGGAAQASPSGISVTA